MRSLTFDELFALLSAISLSTADLARLREWLAGITDPAECIALIEQAARGRPCPHCHCPRSHRCGQASGLQRFRCLGCRRSYNALTGTPLAQKGLLADLSAMRARLAHRAAGGGRYGRASDDEFSLAPPLRARGGARAAPSTVHHRRS